MPRTSTPHIKPDGAPIAETILLPGDPLRAKYIAETFLEDVVQFNSSTSQCLGQSHRGGRFHRTLWVMTVSVGTFELSVTREVPSGTLSSHEP